MDRIAIRVYFPMSTAPMLCQFLRSKNWLAFLDDLRTFCLSAENQITVNLIDMNQLFNYPVPL